MADRPSLEVEIPPARSILYLSSSKELFTHGTGGGYFRWLMIAANHKARRKAGFVFFGTLKVPYWAFSSLQAG